jgi:hypothetical protein
MGDRVSAPRNTEAEAEKAAGWAAFAGGEFRFRPLFLEYQVRADLLPLFGRYFGVEVVMYQGQ